MNKPYRIDGVPVTSKELIQQAADYSDTFKNDWMKSTSRAASILRVKGHKVDENPQPPQMNRYRY